MELAEDFTHTCMGRHAGYQHNARKEILMAICDSCGNDYDKAFQLSISGKTYTFDSFECAIHTVAPHCEHCNVPIIGHGLEQNGRMFCCAHCAQKANVSGLKDRAES